MAGGWCPVQVEFNRSTVIGTVVLLYVAIPVFTLSPYYPHGDAIHKVQLAGAVWGTLCVLAVFFSAWRVPRYRRHPNKLMLWKAVCSLGIGIHIIVVECYLALYCDHDEHGVGSVQCRSFTYCELCLNNQSPAYIMNFFFMASECWCLVQALDLFFSVKNPFYSFRARMPTYHLATWSFAFFDSTLPSAWKDAFQIYGFMEGRGVQLGEYHDTCFLPTNATTPPDELQLNAVCWIRSRYSENFFSASWNFVRLPSLYLWAPVFFFFAAVFVVSWQAYQRLNRGLSGTFAARRRVFAVNFTQSFVFIIWWMVYLVLDWGPVVWHSHDAARVMYGLRSYMIAARGCIELIAWTISNNPKMLMRRADHKSQDYDRDLQPQVNETLRKEVLHYITSSIRMAIRNSAKNADPRASHKRHYNHHHTSKSIDSGLGPGLFPPVPSSSVDRTSTPPGWEREEPQVYVLQPWKKARKLGKMDAFELLRIAWNDDGVEDGVDGGLDGSKFSTIDRPIPFLDSGIRGSSRSSGPHHTQHRYDSAGNKRRAGSASAGSTDGQAAEEEEEEEEEGEPVAATLVEGTARGKQTDPRATSSLHDLLQQDARPTRSENNSVSSETWTPINPEDILWEEEDCKLKQALLYSGLVADDHHQHQQTPRDGTLSPSRGSLASASLSGGTKKKGEREVRFVDHEPTLFKRIRDHFKIDPDKYIDSFRTTAKERLTEGGSSGAFFFYSGCERFMVKSCSVAELETLLELLPDYAEYLCSHKTRQQSFLVRTYGAYTLQHFETDFHFFVMENLFHMEDGEVIQQRFDIKGSTVNRNMTPPRRGQQLTCRHCNQKYTYQGKVSRRSQPTYESRGLLCMLYGEGDRVSGRSTRSSWADTIGRVFNHANHQHWSSIAAINAEDQSYTSMPVPEDEEATSGMERGRRYSKVPDGSVAGVAVRKHDHDCPLRVRGKGHEPNLVLKDNDLTFKLRFSPDEASKVADQLHRDSALLMRHNVMDYSLLLGIRVVEYEVKLVDKEGSSSLLPDGSPEPPPLPPPPPPPPLPSLLVANTNNASGLGPPASGSSLSLSEPVASFPQIQHPQVRGREASVDSELDGYRTSSTHSDPSSSPKVVPIPANPLLQGQRADPHVSGMSVTSTSSMMEGANKGEIDIVSSMTTDDGPSSPDKHRPVRRARLEKRRSFASGGTGSTVNRAVAASPARRVRDYSVEEETHRQVNLNCRESHVVQRTEYYLGVIDILQTWDWSKRLERWWKVRVLGHESDGVSCVCPTIYHHRFIDKMEDIVQLDHMDA